MKFTFSKLFKAKARVREEEKKKNYNNLLCSTLLNFCSKNTVKAVPTGQMDEQRSNVAEASFAVQTICWVQILYPKKHPFVCRTNTVCVSKDNKYAAQRKHH